MIKYTRRSPVVEAERWCRPGDSHLVSAYEGSDRSGRCPDCSRIYSEHGTLDSQGATGRRRVCPGDWVVVDPRGILFACSPKLFVALHRERDAEPGEKITPDAWGMM